MQSIKNRTILILTTYSFPNGLAPTKRIFSYCIGFSHFGYRAEVWSIKPTEPYDNVINIKTEGKINDINFLYPGGTTVRAKSFGIRRFNDLKAKFKCIRLLHKKLKRNELRFLIFYGNNILFELISIVLSKYLNVKIYKEESEHPEIYFFGKNRFLNIIRKWFFINKLYKYYDGILVMTNPLKEFFLSKGILAEKLHLVPQVIDGKSHEKKTTIKLCLYLINI